MITAEVVEKEFIIEVGAINNVSSSSPVIITDTDTPPNVLYTVPAGNTQAIPSSDISLFDTDGNLLDAISVLATQDGQMTAPDGSVTALNTLGDTVGSATVKSNGTASVNIPDSEITKVDGTPLTSLPATESYVVANSTIELRDTAGVLLGTTILGATEDTVITAPDGSINARNSVPTIIATGTVKSGGTTNLAIPDTRINKSDGVQIATTPSTVAYNVADSAIRVQHLNGDLISNTNVKATDPATISVPNLIKDATANFPFPVGTDSLTATIVASTNETYTSNTLTNVTTVSYTLNGSPVSLPFTVANGNTLIVAVTHTNPAAASLVVLNGTYV